MKDVIFLEKINKLAEIENALASIDVAIYLKEDNKSIDEKIQSISIAIDEKAKFYGQKEEKYADEKKSILNNFEEALNKVKEEYDVQYANIQMEKQEAEANMKIVASNHQSLILKKKLKYTSNEYKEYLRTKKSYEDGRDNALKLEDFNMYDRKLAELVDPIVLMDQKLNENRLKYHGYESVANECQSMLEECKKNVIVEFEQIVGTNSNKLLVIEKQNAIQKIISPILGKIGGSKKFQVNVLEKCREEADYMKNEKVITINQNTRNNTLRYLGKINEIKMSVKKA